MNITFSVFPISGDFVYITDSAYTQSQIRQMEIEILKVLNFDLVTVISHLVATILTLQWGTSSVFECPKQFRPSNGSLFKP